MNTTTPPELLTIREMALLLKVSRATAYRLVRDGRIRALQLGGPHTSLRVDRRELEAWLYAEDGGS